MFQQRTEIAHTVYSHAFYRTKTRIRKECVTWPKNFEENSWNFTVLSDNDRATVLVWSTSMNNVTLNIYLSHTFLPPAAQKSPARKAVSKSELPMDSIIIDHGPAYRTKNNVHKLSTLIDGLQKLILRSISKFCQRVNLTKAETMISDQERVNLYFQRLHSFSVEQLHFVLRTIVFLAKQTTMLLLMFSTAVIYSS